jgi:WD40 repeat protein
VVLSTSVLALAFHPRGTILAAACEDGTVCLWDSQADKVRILHGHDRRVRAVAFDRTGDTLASAGQDGTVRLWDTATGQERYRLREHSAAVLGVAFSPDGGRLASASADRTVKLWDAATGQQLLTLRGHPSSVTGVRFSNDGRYLASCDAQGNIRLWQATTTASTDESPIERPRKQREALPPLAAPPTERAAPPNASGRLRPERTAPMKERNDSGKRKR